MSGAEVLATLCNAIELARLGLKLLSICKDIRNGDQPHVDINYSCTAFDEKASTLRDDLLEKRNRSDYESYADLLRNCNLCEEASVELQQEIENLTRPLKRSRSKLRVIWCGILVMWKSNDIARLQRRFEAYRSTLDTNLSIDIW